MGGRLVVVRDWPVGRGQDRDRSYPGKRHDGLSADTGLVVEGPTLLSRFSKAHQDAFSRRPPAGVIGVPLIGFPDSPGVVGPEVQIVICSARLALPSPSWANWPASGWNPSSSRPVPGSSWLHAPQDLRALRC